jgi:hypothetical protein
VANWLIGREIVEEEQEGERRALYGEQLIAELSEKLQKDFGIGYGTTNLKLFRQFFLAYPRFLKGRIGHTLGDQSLSADETHFTAILSLPTEIGHTPCDQLWEPGLLHPNLSWSLYRHLVRVESSNARAFYEIEAIRQLMAPKEAPKKQIGFQLREKRASYGSR